MNQVVPQSQIRLTPLQAFMGKVLPPQERAEIQTALPSHVPFERFERNLQNALMNAPALLQQNPREVFREVAKVAALGLLFDAQLGEAYLIASRTGPQARIGYRGLIKLARQSGDISSLYAHEVHEFDEFECILGDEKRLHHKPDLLSDRGKIVLYYAVVKFKDGETDFEPMTIDQVNRIRDKSDGWKAFKAGKIKDTPWESSYDEMAKKTCIRRLSKRIPQSPDLDSGLHVEDRAEFPDAEMRDVTPIPLAERLAAAKQPAAAVTEASVDAEITGSAGNAADGNAAASENAPQQKDAAASPDQQETGKPAAEVLAEVDGLFADAMTIDDLNAAQDGVEDGLRAMGHEAYSQAVALYEKHETRINALPKAVEDDDTFPGDLPSKPTPQHEPEIYALARQKAALGSRKFKMWSGSISAADADAITPLLAELGPLMARADADAKSMQAAG